MKRLTPRRASVRKKRSARRKKPKSAGRQSRRGRKSSCSPSARRRPKGERKRGGVIAFLSSCIAELKRVQWPDRDTLIQATAVTLVFVIVAALYLGVADIVANWLVQRVI